jgi:hypothetical protein
MAVQCRRAFYRSFNAFVEALRSEGSGWSKDSTLVGYLADQLANCDAAGLGGVVESVPVKVLYERAVEWDGVSTSRICKFTVVPDRGTLEPLVQRMREMQQPRSSYYSWRAAMHDGAAIFVYVR